MRMPTPTPAYLSENLVPPTPTLFVKLFGKNPRYGGRVVSLGQSLRFPVYSLSPLLEEQDAGS